MNEETCKGKTVHGPARGGNNGRPRFQRFRLLQPQQEHRAGGLFMVMPFTGHLMRDERQPQGINQEQHPQEERENGAGTALMTWQIHGGTICKSFANYAGPSHPASEIGYVSIRSEQILQGQLGVMQHEKALRQVVEGQAGGLKLAGQGGEDRAQFIPLRQAMVAGGLVIAPAQRFVIGQAGTSAILRPVADMVGKNPGDEKRLVADVGLEIKAGPVVRAPEGGQHVDKVVEGFLLVGDAATDLVGARKFGQNARHVIGHFPVLQAGPAEHMTDEDVEVEVG
jgi:hypothetical protein